MLSGILIVCIVFVTAGVEGKDCRAPRLSPGTMIVRMSPMITGSRFPPRSTIIVVCIRNHVSKWGSRKRKCLGGRWTGRQLACRKRSRCPAPAPPGGGHVTGRHRREGSWVTFSCRPGLGLVGSAVSKCLPTGRWSSSTPVCKPRITCANPGEVTNAYKVIRKGSGGPTEGFGVDDRIRYQCQEGYLIDGIDEYREIVCRENGQWKGDARGNCTAVSCPQPGTLPNGRHFPAKEHYSFQDTVHFECDENHDLIGPDEITCDGYGSWSGYAPECRAMKCPDPSQPEHGRRIGSSFMVGDTVSFHCMGGFTLRGSRNRTCLPTAQWSGVLTICDRGDSDCPNPGTPVGAVKSGNSYNIGDEVKYTCGSDFLLEGSELRVCLKNGMWSGKETFCRYKYSYVDPQEAAMLFNEKLDRISMETSAGKFGSQLRQNLTLYTDNRTGRAINIGHQYGVDLYLVVDVSGSINEDALNITKDFCKAIVQKVGVSMKIDGTRVTVISFSGEYRDVVTLYDEQTLENVIAKIDGINRITGSKATATATALRRVEDYIASRNTDKVYSQALKALILLTDGKHNTYGSPVTIAERMRSEYNTDIYTIGIGTAVNEEVLQKLASPGQYLRLKHVTDLDSITKIVINGSTGYEECGVGGLRDLPAYRDLEDYVEARDILNWPWMAGLYLDYFRDNTYGTFTCGASLVHPQWLLTAAHCFIKDGTDPSIWQARMGSLTRSNRDGIPLSIAEIFIHPNYTSNVIEYGDIALIKLNDPVILSPTIRTVCLPNDLVFYKVDQAKDWYEAGGWSVVTGWGDINVRRPGDDVELRKNLKFTAMKIKSDKVCENSIKTRLARYTEEMYCAGDGRLRDSCTGDSGGPSMVEVPIGYRSKRVFQVGIVSWGFGCRQKGKYGFYTRIEAYLPWVLEAMESSLDYIDL